MEKHSRSGHRYDAKKINIICIIICVISLGILAVLIYDNHRQEKQIAVYYDELNQKNREREHSGEYENEKSVSEPGVSALP